MKHEFIGWIKLAEAIIEVAKRDLCNGGTDAVTAKRFFDSEWYEELQGTVDLYRNINNDTSTIKELKTLI